MTGIAMGFMITVWSMIFIAIGVTLNALLKGEAKKNNA
ncbi:hypothetical protein L21TH_1386 [Caldisalinibacter kiritimatiensis]|uniref:Uncharacterized protein n=1 Tax=Caldisalinibacter kiritimatiensis TaxID=1304284 RepID=R1ATW2_9FIRM|nr:hypothetical protein L21TH_1386 [Caldisalinibacter kiritimatiensis]